MAAWSQLRRLAPDARRCVSGRGWFWHSVELEPGTTLDQLQDLVVRLAARSPFVIARQGQGLQKLYRLAWIDRVDASDKYCSHEIKAPKKLVDRCLTPRRRRSSEIWQGLPIFVAACGNLYTRRKEATCAYCEQQFEQRIGGRPKKYCDLECKKRAELDRRKNVR